MERYADFEKNIGQMLVNNEIEITTFLLSDTPMSKLLNKDIPAITAAKSELEQLNRLVIILILSFTPHIIFFNSYTPLSFVIHPLKDTFFPTCCM